VTDIFFNINSFLLVFAGLGMTLVFLGFESGQHRAVLVRDLGVPIGLLGSLVGMIQAINETFVLDSADGIYRATAVMLLTTLYGGVASAVGYFFVGSGGLKPQLIADRRRLTLGKWVVLASFVFMWSFAIDRRGPAECANLLPFWRTCGGFSWFYEPIALAIFAVGVTIGLVKSEPGCRGAGLSQSLLLSTMISVTCGIIMLFSGEALTGLSVAGCGLTLGLFGYVGIYVVTYASETEEPPNATLMNWHWMEVAAFYIFMFLAPDTILDDFQQNDVQDQILLLEDRVRLLEAYADE
jgi:hypothetical protein